LVGLIIPELTNPIFPALAQVIEQVLTSHGFTPVLCTQTPGGSTEDQLTELLVDRGVTGIVFVSGLHSDTTEDMDRYVRLTGQGVPFVMVNGYTEKVSAPFVSTDDRAAMRLAVSHLVELGHERIGLSVGPQRFVPALRKIEGFLEALPDGLVQHSLFTVEGGQAAASALLDKECTAIICGNDLMALGAVRAARTRGLAVPADVSVVGFDDSPLIVFTDPPLTTLRQPVEAMGQAAVNALLEEIAGTPAPHVEYVFQPELVVRGSTAARARTDRAGYELPQVPM
jgi:DNA-binding LacI/PurR family transcriptional regulator